MGQTRPSITQTVEPTPVIIQVVQPQTINWKQAFVDGGFAFLATLFGFILALWWERKKTEAANTREKIQRQEDLQHERMVREEDSARERQLRIEDVNQREEERKTAEAERLQVLTVAILRELHKAFEEFRSSTCDHPRADRIFETFILETTSREQLELFKNPQVLKRLFEVRPDILAYKYCYGVALDNYSYAPVAMGVRTPQHQTFERMVSGMKSIQNRCKTNTKELAVLLVSQCPNQVPDQLDANKWTY